MHAVQWLPVLVVRTAENIAPADFDRRLAQEQVDHLISTGVIPSGKLQDVKEFWQCLQCGKVVWKGTQFRQAMTLFEQLIEETQSSTKSL